MNKKRLLGLASAFVLALCGCADTSELYERGLYYSSVFVDNVYTVWDSGLREARLIGSKDLTNSVTAIGARYFNGSGDYSSEEKCFGFEQAKEWYGQKGYFQHKGKDLFWAVSPYGTEGGANGFDTYAAPGRINPKDETLNGVVYSQTKKLTRYSESFKRGILSKLYNGQIKCDAWSYLSMILLDQRGYATLFPCQLVDAPYFAFSARGSSDTSSGSRVTTFNIDVSFYKFENDEFVKNTFCLKDVKLQTNRSSELTSLVGFDFKEIGYDPKGMVGMSVVPTLVDDGTFDTTIDFGVEEKDHTGVSMLEVLFGDSTWK